VTPPGIDPGTVAQRLDHYATPGPDHLQFSANIHEGTFRIFCQFVRHVYIYLNIAFKMITFYVKFEEITNLNV
jgi:hypothetical protein